MRPLDDAKTDLDISAKLIRRGNYFLRYLESRQIMPPTEVAKPVSETYAEIVSFFAGDCGISRPKGFMIFGPTGCGKTTLVRAIKECCKIHLRKQNFPHGFIFTRARRLIEDFGTYEDFLPDLREMTRRKAVILDDLGIEKPGNRFGQTWGLESFLEDRYETWEEYGFPTLITTNYQTPKAVLERYGERAMSRLVGMVHFIAYNYRDRRMSKD